MRYAATALWAPVALAVLGSATLTQDNYHSKVVGKAVLLKFYANWCDHCKELRPTWDKLMDAFKNHETVLVSDVDCTADGRSLCQHIGINAYPSLRYGDPIDLQEYKGGRKLWELKMFAGALVPDCNPEHLHLCHNATRKAQMEEFMKLGKEELGTMVVDLEKKIEEDQENLKNAVAGVQGIFKDASKDQMISVNARKRHMMMSLTHSHEMARPENAHIVEELSKKMLEKMKAEAEANETDRPFRSRLLELVEEIAANTSENGTLDRDDVTKRMVQAMAQTVGPKVAAEGLAKALKEPDKAETSDKETAEAEKPKPDAAEEKSEL
jgi:thiol-disulfide isomerase/thioredoxin